MRKKKYKLTLIHKMKKSKVLIDISNSNKIKVIL